MAAVRRARGAFGPRTLLRLATGVAPDAGRIESVKAPQLLDGRELAGPERGGEPGGGGASHGSRCVAVNEAANYRFAVARYDQLAQWATEQAEFRYAMTTRLPQGGRAILDIRKIEEYCLSPSHPRGRHKARVFREALGLQRGDAAWLRTILLAAARVGAASQVGADAWGTRWRLDVTVTRQGRSAVVRTIWILRTGERAPRFATCWVL